MTSTKVVTIVWIRNASIHNRCMYIPVCRPSSSVKQNIFVEFHWLSDLVLMVCFRPVFLMLPSLLMWYVRTYHYRYQCHVYTCIIYKYCTYRSDLVYMYAYIWCWSSILWVMSNVVQRCFSFMTLTVISRKLPKHIEGNSLKWLCREKTACSFSDVEVFKLHLYPFVPV